MSFKHKSTVIYKVHPEPGGGERSGHVSVRTDRHAKGGWWTVSNKAIVQALVDGSYLNSWMIADDVVIEGDDDGVLFITYYKRGREEPLYQLEYERHHHIDEPSKSFFGSEPSKPNPTSDSSTLQTVGWIAFGVTVVGLAGWWLYSTSKANTAATQAQNVLLPAQPAQTPQTQDQVPPFIPSDVSQPIGV